VIRLHGHHRANDIAVIGVGPAEIKLVLRVAERSEERTFASGAD
jgi:hypothetical protein